MSRLIDADALTERLNEYANDDWNVSLGGVFTDAVDTCLDFIENAPTIEAVPVVERNKIIDEFADRLKHSLIHNHGHLLTVDTDGFEWLTTDAVGTHIDEISERMKGGAE